MRYKVTILLICGLLVSCGDSGSDEPAVEANNNQSEGAASGAPKSGSPVIKKFIVGSKTTIPIVRVDIEGSDDRRVAGWVITETSSVPNINDNNWQSKPPSYYSLFAPGKTTLYAWAKDGSGNVSDAAIQVVEYVLPTVYSNYFAGDFLQSPQNAIDFIKVSADFWKAARDNINGGFFTNIDQRGNVLENRDKSFLTQSRDAYGFARAFMVTGDERYLDDARHALEFLYDHGWDAENDGWYLMANEFGDISAGTGWEWDYNTKTKWSFQQHYALLGIAALYEANRSDTEYEWLARGYDSNELHLWDNDVSSFGYFDVANKDWSSPRGKGFTPTVDAVTTNVLALYLLTQDEKYLNRLKQLGNNMIAHLGRSIDDPKVKIGMAELFNGDWTYNTTDFGWDSGNVGHVLKAAWCLGRIYLLTGDQKYRQAAKKFVQRSWTDGSYDHLHGGPYTDFNWRLGVITNNDKDFWNLEQGYTGGIISWYIDEDEASKAEALEMARGSIGFFMTNLPDRLNGEIYERTSSDGSAITSDAKGNLFKAGYHGIELGYYAYLYGSLYYEDQPVSLYYKIEKTDKARSIKLWPLAIEDAKLKISGVKLDGQLYSGFESEARVLAIPAGVGGKFQVTFERKS